MSTVAYSPRVSDPIIATAGQTDFEAGFPPPAPVSGVYSGIYVARLRAPAVVPDILTVGTDFSLINIQATTFSVRLNVGQQAGDVVRVFGKGRESRSSIYVTGRLDSDALEAEFVRQSMRLQEHARDIDRAMVSPLGEAGVALPAAAVRANKLMGFGADGKSSVTRSLDAFDADVSNTAAKETAAANSATAAANSQATTLDLKNQTQALRDQSQGILNSITPAGAAAIGQIVAQYDEAAAALDTAKTDALNSVAADVAASAASAATAVTAKDDTLAAKSAVDTQAGAVATAKAAVDTAKAAVDTTAATVNTQAGDVATAKAAVDTAKAAVDIAKAQTDTNAATATTKAAEAAASAASISIGTPGGVAALAQNVLVAPKHLRPVKPAANKRVYALSKGFALGASAADNQWKSIAYAQKLGRLVAVAGSGTNRVMYSDDWGKTWTLTASADDAATWASVAWSEELGLFAAVAQAGAGNRVMTSPDGITWTLRASSNDGNVWVSVCWASELGRFVAVAAGGSVSTRAMWSADGITWAAATSGVIGSNFKSVVWAAEFGLFIAIATTAGTTTHVITSPDGQVWTARTSPDFSWESLTYSPWLRRLVAVASGGAGTRVMTSDDGGITWTARNAADDTQTWVSVIWADTLGLFYAFASTGTGTRCMTSRDGISWTLRATAADNAWAASCWVPDAEIAVVVGQSGTGTRVMRSYSAIALGAGSNDDLLDRQWTGPDSTPAALRGVVEQAFNDHKWSRYYNVLDACTTFVQRLAVVAGTVAIDIIWPTALAAAIAAGQDIYIPPGNITLTPGIQGLPLNIGASAVGVIGCGDDTKITKTAATRSVFYTDMIGPTLSLGRMAANVTAGDVTLPFEAGQNPGTFAANDLLILNDQGTLIIDNSRHAGEFVTVQAVSNAGNGSVTLWHPTKYGYAAGTGAGQYARLSKPTMLRGVSVRDLWIHGNNEVDSATDIVNTSGVAACGAVSLKWCREAVVSGVRVSNHGGTAIRFLNGYQCLVKDCNFFDGGSSTTGTSDPTSTEGLGGFAYGVQETALNEGLVIDNVRAVGYRHLRTSSSAPTNDVSGTYWNYGQPYGTKLKGCNGWRMKNMTFDDHELDDCILYDFCSSWDGHYAAWQIRGRNIKLKRCGAYNHIGPAAWIRGSGSGNAYADACSIDGLEIERTNLGTTFDGINWTTVGAVLDDAHNTRTRGVSGRLLGGPVIQVGDTISPNNSQHYDVRGDDVCQKAASNKYVVYLKKVGTTGVCRVERVRSYSSDAKVVDHVYIDSGVGAARIFLSDIAGQGNTGVDWNNQSASAIVHYGADSSRRIRRSDTQYYDMSSDATAHKLSAFSPAASAKGLIIAVNTDASFTAPTGGALGFDVYINNVRGIGCDATGQVLQGGSVISDANRLLVSRSYTVATLPTTASSGSLAFASNARVFNGAGVQEGSGAGTGGSVTRVGAAWKLTGTNVTAIA